MGYSLCKMLSLGQKLKFYKTCEKRLYKHIIVALWKNGFKKHLIFEKAQHFENDHNWSQCMGYSLCKMLSLGQKFKFSKTCEKRLYKHIRVVLCKKRLQKAPNIRKMTTFRKWPKLVTMHGLKPLQNAQFGSKIEILKTLWKTTLQAH